MSCSAASDVGLGGSSIDEAFDLQCFQVLPEGGVTARFEAEFLADQIVQFLRVAARDMVGLLEAATDPQQDQFLVLREDVDLTRLEGCLAQCADSHVFWQDVAAAGFLGPTDGRVEQFDGVACIAALARETADLGESLVTDRSCSAGDISALARDAGQGRFVVGCEFDDIRLAEPRDDGRLEEFQQSLVLTDHNQ